MSLPKPEPIEVLTSVDAVNAYTDDVRGGRCDIVLTELGSGLLGFSEALYPGVASTKLMSAADERIDGGSGAHFDVEHTMLDPDFPFAGSFNLVGEAAIVTTMLDSRLQAVYDEAFPEVTDEAFRARRPLSRFAILSPLSKNFLGDIRPGTGLIVPQLSGTPYCVHQVGPISDTIGKFVRVVKRPNDSQQDLPDLGYAPLSEKLDDYLRWGREEITLEDLCRNE